MNTYDFVHLTLLAMGGTIRGKTKLQKTVYFLGVITDDIEELGYRAHYYGPYSDEVANAVGRLRALGFVSKSTTTWGIDARGFEIARTDYSLTEEGQTVAELKAQRHSEFWGRLQRAISALREAGDLNYVKLSVAAKTFFILGREGAATTRENLVGLARKFGWSVSSAEVTEATDFLKSLELVRVADA